MAINSIRYAETMLPTKHGLFRCIVYRLEDGCEHIAMVRGDLSNTSSVLCRLHSECLTSEVLGSVKCDCKEQLDQALCRINEENCGVLIYLRQEGRGIGLGNKIKAYKLQEEGLDTVDANRMLGFPDDGRDFLCGVRILKDLQISCVRLLTNNPHKVEALINAGIQVSERLPHISQVNPCAAEYMRIKCERMGHYLMVNNDCIETTGKMLFDQSLTSSPA